VHLPIKLVPTVVAGVVDVAGVAVDFCVLVVISSVILISGMRVVVGLVTNGVIVVV